jgi:hypothetical protein
VDYDSVNKHLGPGKLSLTDFSRDMDTINKVYIPLVTRCKFYMQIGTGGMLGAFALFILMGIVGGTPEARGVLLPIIFLIFLGGLMSSTYSRWIEQPAIKEGAAIVKKMLDEDVNPRYADSRFRIRWTVRVYMQPKSTIHLGQTFVEQPIISIYSLRSPNSEDVLTDWTLPEVFLSGLFVDVSAKDTNATDEDEDGEHDFDDDPDLKKTHEKSSSSSSSSSSPKKEQKAH